MVIGGPIYDWSYAVHGVVRGVPGASGADGFGGHLIRVTLGPPKQENGHAFVGGVTLRNYRTR